MPPRHASSQRKANGTSPRKASRVSTLRFDSPPPAKKQKLRPLSFLSQPPVFDFGDDPPPEIFKPLSQKNRAPERSRGSSQTPPAPKPNDDDVDDQLWIDRYAPQTEEELAVHVRKVRDVRQWFLEAFEGGPSGKLRKYRRILVLTGPAGTAKTTTVQLLARELGFDIVEWKNTVDERFDTYDDDDRLEYEGLSDKFCKFFTRATSCHSIFGPSSQPTEPGASQKPRPSSSQPAFTKRQIILLEDLPNILHAGTKEAFHTVLKNLVKDGESAPSSPVVIIISDAGLRGEDGEDVFAGSTWKGKGREAVDVRSVLPSSVLVSNYVTQISFNPIAATLMKRALQNLITTHFASHSGPQPSKELLDIIVESSNGDIRSAVMALQFACVHPDAGPGNVRASRKGRKTMDKRVILESVTRREQTLALFHLIGKILYNKRKGDAPAPSASAKDIQRDKAIDARLFDPPRLPPHLAEHKRKPSRVDVEELYADSPIDASMLSLYVHQNYTQYCDTVEECADLMDRLSWVDANGGESWLQANPHRFHLVTLGTLHALPTPVPRRSQKPYKPEFFAALQKEREAGHAVRDAHGWLRRHDGLGSGWTSHEVAVEAGAVLRARDVTGESARARPPPNHRLFSALPFERRVVSTAELADDNDVMQEDRMLLEQEAPAPSLGDREEVEKTEAELGGWLESDEIDEF